MRHSSPPAMRSSMSFAMCICIRCLYAYIIMCVYVYVCIINTTTHVYQQHDAFKPSSHAGKHVVSHVCMHPVRIDTDAIHTCNTYVRTWLHMYVSNKMHSSP